jgi:hypothetical protein
VDKAREEDASEKPEAGQHVEETGSLFFVAVHVGAGYHAPSNEKAYCRAMRRACAAAAAVLSQVMRLVICKTVYPFWFT